MKNRRLLFGFLALIFGAGMILLTTSGSFRQIVGSSVKGNLAEGLENGWDYLSQIRGNQSTGEVDPADVLKARNQVSGLRKSGAIGLNWSSMGPDNFAGRTRALILDNRDNSGSTVFAGSVSGGLWKSTTSGLTWNQIQTGGVILNVSCMAQSKSGEIYVGTGETFASDRFNLFSGFIGQGIYKSTDGNSFTKLASTDPGTYNDPTAEWAFVNKIAAGENNRVIAATNYGLKYSSDGGQSWSMASAGGENLSGTSNEVKIGPDGAIAASVDNKLYVSPSGTADGFILRSTGIGQDSLPAEGVARIEVAFAPSDASTLYAVLISDGTLSGTLRGQLKGIFVSKNKGETWRLVGPGASPVFNVFGNAANTTHYGDYAASIVVSPTNPDKIYVGGVNVWEGLKILDDGFYQWQQKTLGDAGLYFHQIFINPANEGNVFMASDQGLYLTDDAFFSNMSVNKNYGTSMFYTVAYDDKGRAIGGSQGNGVVFLDQEGNTPETGNVILPSFVGGSVEFSMINPTAVFYSSTAGNLVRSNDLGVSPANDFIYNGEVTNNNGNVFITPFRIWEDFNNPNSRDSITFHAKANYNTGDVLSLKSKNAQFPFRYTLTQPLANGDSLHIVDPVSSIFFVGMTNAVYMSRDVLDFGKLPSWDRIANLTGVPSCLAYSSDANYLYVGTTDGKLLRIANIALAYDSLRADVRSSACIISSGIVKDFGARFVTSIAVDPNDDNHVIVTLGNYGNSEYVFRSTNALAQFPDFNPIQGNLPAMPVYSCLIEMNSSSRVILGTDLGVFTTESLGSSPSWTAENTGLGEIPVMMVRQQTVSRPWIDGITGVSNFGAIYLASHGNGIFENRMFVGIDGPGPDPQGKAAALSVYPNPVKSDIHFNVSLNGSSSLLVNLYSLQGKLVKSVNFGMPGRGEHQLTIPASDLVNGTYLMQVTEGSSVKTAKFVVTK
ncbi:T9SS type A sorting domain-containing protein [Lentimicrobium sp.]|uniref:T9SS type A sorting domain-containing protein n=2 Tax=Lentimicrobium sp. TaxID=2034841 RepID=UPI002C0C3969|nr:T9SS type A sorting domain-containing protein [Lentimicrobium sp.]HPF65151.1 T9SS type A sorting domain-containing protein [Lentimicrobium sp.]